MAVNHLATPTIASIELQIATVTEQLEQARAQELATAEKLFLAAQQATANAQAKVDMLVAGAGTTAAAITRLKTAQTALATQQQQLLIAEQTYSALVAAQAAAKKLDKKIAKVMAGKKLGKKIKFTKAEKAVIKEDKKAAKRLAKTAKKAANNHASIAHEVEAKLPLAEPTALEHAAVYHVSASTQAPTAAAKKPVVKRASAKRPAPKSIPVQPEAAPAPTDANREAFVTIKAAPLAETQLELKTEVASELAPAPTQAEMPSSNS